MEIGVIICLLLMKVMLLLQIRFSSRRVNGIEEI